MYLPLVNELKHPAWAGLEWIWTPEDLENWPPALQESRYFRQTFSIPGQPVRAWIQVWTGAGYELWVNGWSAYQSPRGILWSHQDEVEHLLRPGKNTIAVEHYGGRWRGGLLVAGEVELSDGQVVPIRSDTTWQCRQDQVADWCQPDAPPAGWRQVGRTVDGWKAAGAPTREAGGAYVDQASFDPAVFRQQVASFYSVDDPERLHVEGERYVAFQAGGYWAPLERLPDGSIAAIVRAGGCHSGREGRLLFIRSPDGGRTWTSPVVIADSPWEDFGSALGVTSDGTLIVGYKKNRRYDGRGNYLWRADDETWVRYYQTMVVRSEDGGETWGAPQVISQRGTPARLPYGKMIEFPDGTVWMAEYHGTLPSYRVSQDQGRTWGPPRPISTQGGNETALLRLREGPIVAAMRGFGKNGDACAVSMTRDEGATWSSPVLVTEEGEHPPDLIQLRSGRLLLTFGRRKFPEGVQAMLSDDRGATWYRPPRFILTWDALHDHGYPSSVQLDDGTIVTIYYATGNRLHPEVGVHTGVVRWTEEGCLGG